MSLPDKRAGKDRQVAYLAPPPIDVASIKPALLDLCNMVFTTAKAAQALSPNLERLLKTELKPQEYIEAIEKLGRAAASWAKAFDLATRLSLILTGQADHRVEKMEEKSDAELMSITSGMMRKMLTPAWLARQIHDHLNQMAVHTVEKKLWLETRPEYQEKLTKAATAILSESPLAA